MGAKSIFTGRGKLSGLKSAAVAIKAASGADGPQLTERLAALPRLARATSSGRYKGVSGAQVAMLTAAAAYVVSPVDLLPEALLGILGLADDALVISWFATTLVRVTDEFLAWEKLTGETLEGELAH